MNKWETDPEIYRSINTGTRVQIVKDSTYWIRHYSKGVFTHRTLRGGAVLCRQVNNGKYWRFDSSDLLPEKDWLERERNKSSRKTHRKPNNERSKGFVEETQDNNRTMPAKAGSNWLPWKVGIDWASIQKTSKSTDGKVV